MTINPNGNADGADLPAVEHHRKTSRRLIRQAAYELEKRGDRVQACDKASGAVAHGVKAAAAVRHWRSDSHNYRRRIVDLLAVEYDRSDLVAMQDIADKLHDNFYEDTMYEPQVALRLEQLTGLLSTFMGLLEREPNPDFVPDPQQERMLTRLRLTAEEIADLRAMEYPPPPPEEVLLNLLGSNKAIIASQLALFALFALLLPSKFNRTPEDAELPEED